MTNRLIVALVPALLVVAACSASAPPATSSGQGVASPVASPSPAGSVGSASPVAPSQPAVSALAPSNATFSIAVGVTPNTMDPLTALGGELNPETFNVLEPLFKVDNQKHLLPFTAQSYDASPDGLAVTIKLKPNLTFQDGTLLDANAVKFNFERAADPKNKGNNIDYYKNMVEITAVDQTTVKLRLTQPSPVLPFILANSSAAMISPASMKLPGNANGYAIPVGTGPFTFKEYTSGDHATLERYDGYWGAKPYYKTITYRFVPEDNTRESLLLSKQVDAIAAPPLTDIANLQQNKAVKVQLNTSNRNMAVFIETEFPGLSDVRVRQAMNYAVDKVAGLKAVMFGLGEVMQAPTAPSDFGFCVAGSYAYDPGKAKQLLQDAGQTNLKVHMVSPTGRYPQDFQTAQVVANYLQQVGITVDLETMAWPALAANILQPADKQTAGLKLLGIGGTTVDASTTLRTLTKDTFPPRGINVSFFTSPETEKLFAEQATNLDQTTREKQLCELEKSIWNQAPWIFLWNPKYAVAYQSGLEGLTFDFADAEQFLLAGIHPVQ